MVNFGSLEFVLDRYSGTWCWKISGTRAVNMVSKLIPRGWYGDKPDEVIVSDSDESIKKLKMIDDRYPFEILSKSPFNVVLQESYPKKDDGSLSWAAVKCIRPSCSAICSLITMVFESRCSPPNRSLSL